MLTASMIPPSSMATRRSQSLTELPLTVRPVFHVAFDGMGRLVSLAMVVLARYSSSMKVQQAGSRSRHAEGDMTMAADAS